MIFYMILMLVVAVFFFREGKKIKEQRSELLKEYCTEPALARDTAKLMVFLGGFSLLSGLLMLFCFVYGKMTGDLPRWMAAVSIFVYGAGFVTGMLKLNKIQKTYQIDHHK